MTRLNLPQYDFKIKNTKKGYQIFDPLRRKYIVLTPEEWVRQHFIQYLINEKKYPASLISIETGLKYNRLQKRSDIIIYDRNGKPWIIIECKAPQVPISQKIFDQVAVYNAAEGTRAKYLAITNGIKHYCCEIQYEKSKEGSRFRFLNSFPEVELYI